MHASGIYTTKRIFYEKARIAAGGSFNNRCVISFTAWLYPVSAIGPEKLPPVSRTESPQTFIGIGILSLVFITTLSEMVGWDGIGCMIT